MSDLPVNIDTTYDDDAGDASVKAHQQHHDALHAVYNDLAGASPDLASLGIAADDHNHSGDLAGKVDKTTFDANTILKADTDDTPSALTVAASRIVGRKASGSIGALTLAEVVALGGTPDGTKFLRDDGTLATPSGGGSVLPPIRSNTTHPTVAPGLIRLAFANAQFTAAANTTYYFGPYLTGGITIDAGIFNINAVTGTANVRWAIIPIDTSTWQPSGVTIDFGSNSYTTGGQKTITISSTPIAAGSYFVGLKTDNATLQLKGMTAQPVTGWRGSENGYQTIRHRSKAETFGAWAATPTAWDTATSIASTGTAGLDHLLDWRVA